MKKLICLLFALLLVVAGCGGKNPATFNKPAKGSVTLAIKSSGLTAKTIQPDLDMTIAFYDVYGVGPDGVNFRKNDQSSSSVSLEALAAGLWAITVAANNDEGINIASGYTDITVIAGINTNTGVTVTPLTGTGALKVNLSWPGGTITNPVINATLAPKGGVASGIAFALAEDSLLAIYENNAIEAGYYTLLVYLYDGTTFKWGAAEAVRIIKGQTSEGSYPIIPGGGEIGDINLIITPDLQNPIDITFNGAVDNLNIGTNMTVIATTSEEVETYQWYLNGKPLSGETKDTIVIGSTLPRGSYRLDLLVMKHMTISSASATFTVSGTGATPVATPSPVTPFPTPASTFVVAVAGGHFHGLAMKNDGTVWSWGYNSDGQLGDGTNIDRSYPSPVTGLNGVVAIAGGHYHSLALKSDGAVWGWGDNEHGQLGDGNSYSDRNHPVQVSGLSGVIAIAAGSLHSLALKNDGTVWAWGYNAQGQLGNGTNTERNQPVQVSGLTGIVAIAAGNYHGLALKNNGTVWSWGNNECGQLGDGMYSDQNLPVQVPGLNGITALTAGYSHNIAINNDGIWAWGYNDSGQIGDETNINRNLPVEVHGLDNITSLAGSTNHSLGLKSNGTVWAWGYNFAGQIGDGTSGSSIIRYLPLQVAGLTEVTAISCGDSCSFALKSDGTVWSWGWNVCGQLGDGTHTNRSVPVQVSGL